MGIDPDDAVTIEVVLGHAGHGLSPPSKSVVMVTAGHGLTSLTQDHQAQHITAGL
jgi:hypothetical protein